MKIRRIAIDELSDAQRQWIQGHSYGSFWQSVDRIPYIESVGKEVRIYSSETDEGVLQAAAVVVIDKTVCGYSTWDVPRGPLFDDEESARALMLYIKSEARKERCMAVYFSPEVDLQLPKAKPISPPRCTTNALIAAAFASRFLTQNPINK